MAIDRSLHRWAPVFYLLVALPTVAVLTFLTPPAMVPDENSHFLRAVQISQGEFVGQRPSLTEAGGTVPFSAIAFGEALDEVIGHGTVKVDRATIERMGEIRWDAEAAGFATFYNTVIYVPVFYLPASLGILVGRHLDLSVAATFEIARLATGLAAVGLGALAIRFASRGRALLTVLLSLPMTLYQFASVSQDAMLIASLALVAGLCSGAAGQRRPLGRAERLVAFGLLGLGIATRPSYVPLLALSATRLLRPDGDGGTVSRLARRLWAPGLACAIAVSWILLGAAPVKVPFRVGEGVSEAGQISYLLHHASTLLDVASKTVSSYGLAHYRQFLGVFGWSDFYLPESMYVAATATLLLASALTMWEPGGALNRLDGITVALSWMAAWVMIYATLYVTWTPVAAPVVDGVQGRYFIPSAMMLVLILPALLASPVADERSGGRASPVVDAEWTMVFLAIMGNAMYVPYLVMSRFYR